MAISERRRLTFTVIAVILLAILTWLLIYGMLLLPPRQYLSSTTTTPTPEPIQPQRTNEVTITGGSFGFYPPVIIVPVGTTVTWTNIDVEEAHTVISDIRRFDRYLLPNATFSYTFTQPGTYNYHCGIHEALVGTVIVE